MDKYEAQDLVRTTLQNPFNKDRFYYLVKNLLNKFDEEATFIYRGKYIPDAYKPYIDTLERIGKYQDLEDNKIDILIVHLKKESSLEYARTMQRNFVAWYLNGSRGGELKDAALVAFVSPDPTDWRFSLVKMEYKITETPSGRKRAKEEFTPAKRFSFLVGLYENSHTAQSRLVPIIQDDVHNPTLNQFEDSFNIEKVTKEFFEKYRELFLKVKETLDEFVKKDEKIKLDFTEKQISTVDFAKKLLGQIVFLYFLQKKGWFGVERDNDWGTGSKDFLRRLYEKMVVEYDNYFNDILEPLFYEALAKERDDNFYSRFNCKIPFLNGGLFDPIGNYDWVHTDIKLPNDLFSNSYKTKEGDTGTGILDVFDRYNFTVKEDEPLEKEVAVDPEMLGKVFENLLEVKDRKSKGTYYTPREIVHYMCQESLINYLVTECEGKVSKEDIETLIKFGETVVEHDSRVGRNGKETQTYSYKLPESIRKNADLLDEKLKNIRVCDPAIGSGAFPVGMMNEIIRTRNALTNYLKDKSGRTIYDFKRHAIQNCLYGVDIDPGAVEIAKLRLWLSLVVDEEDIKSIKPLPNLDYKIVWGDSLSRVEKDLFNAHLFTELEEIKPLYFDETNATKKQEYRRQIEKLIKEITNDNKHFDFEVYFSEVFHKKGGFDIIIANPPYGADIPESELRTIKKRLRDTSNTNSAAIFIDFGKNLLINDSGTLTYIVPKSLLFADKWFDLVKAMLSRVSVLVDVEKAFENVKLEQVVFLYGNTIEVDKYVAKKFLDDEFIRSVVIPNTLVLKYQAWICDVSDKEIKIAETINRPETVDYMRNISNTKRGVTLQRYLKQTGDYPVIGGKNIFRYGIQGVKGYLSQKDFSVNSSKLMFLKQPKIILQRLVAHIQNPEPHLMIMATYDSAGNVLSVDTVENTVLNNKNYDYRYIIAVINSTFVSWYTYKFIFCSAIRTMDFDNYYLGKVPIPKVGSDVQEQVIPLVDEIINLTKEKDYSINTTRQNLVKEYEKQIDQMVYKLYGLTPEEISIMENISNED